MDDDILRYEKMVENALRGVVRESLQEVAEFGGLPDDHHFYLTFLTTHEGVEISDALKSKYPDEMTIVLQYQFWDLIVKEDFFSVTLSFNNVSEKLRVPFTAVTGFADPSVKFGLQFHTELWDEEFEDEMDMDDDPTPPTTPKPPKKSGDQDNVVTLDQFRKDKKD